METVYDDYIIMKDLGYRNSNRHYLVKCRVCGHEKECSFTNLKRQDNHHSARNCKDDYYAPFVGEQHGDYIITAIYNNAGKYNATVQCSVCGHTVSGIHAREAFKERRHNATTCRDDYYKQAIGNVYGDIKIVGLGGYTKGGNKQYVCKCTKCGVQSLETMLSLKRFPKHGAHCLKAIPPSPYKTAVMRRFSDMYQRCNNPNNNNYKHYGGRGIKLRYESAVDLYLDFYDELVEFAKTHGLKDSTFDRIDVNGDYEKGNLRIASHSVQSTNTRRKKVFILSKGDERVLSDSSAAAAKYIGSTASAVGNVVRGASKTCNGWKLHKRIDVSEDLNKVSKCESVTTKLIVT